MRKNHASLIPLQLDHMMIEFPHTAPQGYSYEFEEFKKNVISIWIYNHRKFDYNLGKPVRSIWGFYDSKKRIYSAPINAKSIGAVVGIENTTPYSAMQLKQTPLESAYV